MLGNSKKYTLDKKCLMDNQMFVSFLPSFSLTHLITQADDAVVLVKTIETGSEGSPTQMATEPASGVLGYQPHLVKAVTSGATSEAMTTLCQSQKDDIPQYAEAVHGRYTRPRNEQVHVLYVCQPV